MGLDMYLSARKYMNRVDWAKTNSNKDGKYITYPEFNKVVKLAGLSNVVPKKDIYGMEINVTCAYWRKANQIHAWFVTNVQGGEDNCEDYYVSPEKLGELLEVCKTAKATKDSSLLQPLGGFFFGSTEVDKYYWQDIKNTIEQLERVLALEELDSLSLYYRSSW